MNALVVIPTNMHKYSFSAPLAWMFSKNIEKVKGVFSFELTDELIKRYKLFIIELNWFNQIYEFVLIAEYIKKTNKDSKILFGGLYASLEYKNIFKKCNVDYYIKGDNEIPIQMMLDSINPKEIPNMIGKNLQNPCNYTFKKDEYHTIDFNLDWIPSYLRNVKKIDCYHLPMIITAKGGCGAVHSGCDHCMGSKHQYLKEIYNRAPIFMENAVLMSLLEQVSEKFEMASLLICSQNQYDFAGQYFEIEIHIEIDAPYSIDRISEILHAFKKCKLTISVYEEGLTGKVISKNFKEILKMEDDDHRVYFFSFKKDALKVGIPKDHILDAETVLPEYAFWDYYSDIEQAYLFSEFYYNKLDKYSKFIPGRNRVSSIDDDIISTCGLSTA